MYSTTIYNRYRDIDYEIHTTRYSESLSAVVESVFGGYNTTKEREEENLRYQIIKIIGVTNKCMIEKPKSSGNISDRNRVALTNAHDCGRKDDASDRIVGSCLLVIICERIYSFARYVNAEAFTLNLLSGVIC